jgi:hypothetical protein
MPGVILGHPIRGAITARTQGTLARATSARAGHPSVPTPRTPPYTGHRQLSCRRQGRGHLSAAGLREKWARQVAESRRGTQSRRGPGTVEKTQEPPDPNTGTYRTSRRVSAPDVAPPWHRRGRRRHPTGAGPARGRACALPGFSVTRLTAQARAANECTNRELRRLTLRQAPAWTAGTIRRCRDRPRR